MRLIYKDEGDKEKILACSKRHLVIRGLDGKERRFPVDEGTVEQHNGIWMGRTLKKQAQYIYDSRTDYIQSTHAEYKFDENQQTLSYYVGDKKVQSVMPGPKRNHEDLAKTIKEPDIFGARDSDKGLEAYKLGEGKWMVPQPELRDCMPASLAMLLCEGKDEEYLKYVLKKLGFYAGRQKDDYLINEVKNFKRTGKIE